MSQRTIETPANVPNVITILQEGTTIAGKVRHRGEVIEITDDLYRDTIDRNGDSILDLDERRQVERWKRALWKVGDHGATIRKGDQEAQEQREAARDRDGSFDALAREWEHEDRLRAKHATSSRTVSKVVR